MKRIALASIFLLAAGSPAWAFPDCTNPAGTWVNQLRSTLTIVSVSPSSGAMTGTYRSPSGTPGQPFPMLGWTHKATPVPGSDNVVLITFSVRWGEAIGSITAWSGLCREENGVSTLTALWDLTRANSRYTWDHVLTGTDVFTPSRATGQ